MNETHSTDKEKRSRGGWVGGAVLVLIGLMALANQYIEFNGWIFMGALGLIFLLAGLGTRKAGLIIPGGILSGIALGIYLIEGPYRLTGDPAKGGIFLLAFAAGWVLITLLSLFVSALAADQPRLYWALIPAGVLAATGGLLVTNNLRALELVGMAWPLVLIAVGLYIVLKRRQEN